MPVPPKMRHPRTAALDELNAAIRREILMRYARISTGGRPLTCRPSHHELDRPATRKEGYGTDGKVIFPNEAAALACADEMTRRLGDPPMHAYACARSRSGHHHLTVATPPTRGGRS